MKHEISLNYGKLYFQFSPGIEKVSRQFMEELIEETVWRFIEYYENTGGDQIFVYREKQMHTALCPSISQIANSFLIEQPVKRSPSGESEYSGAVDYWVDYDNFSFFLELKHSYFAYNRSKTPRQDIANKFEEALDQLKEIEEEECDRLALGKGLIKIALQSVVFYKGSKDKENLYHIDEDFKDLLNQMIENLELQEKINVKVLWILHEDLNEPFDYKNKSEIYPAVAFIGDIQNPTN